MTSAAVEVVVTVGAVLLGGFLSYVASLRVERMRLTRETRVQLYEEHIPEAKFQLSRWRDLCENEGVLARSDRIEALDSLAQVRRAAVVAGKADRREIKELWGDAYQGLSDVDATIVEETEGSRSLGPGRRIELAERVVEHTETVLAVLRDYEGWLEDRIS